MYALLVNEILIIVYKIYEQLKRVGLLREMFYVEQLLSGYGNHRQ